MIPARAPAYHQLLQAFIERYVALDGRNGAAELHRLQATLGRPLSYTLDEGRVFMQLGANNAYLTGVTTSQQLAAREYDSTGPALLQLWDFVATMDKFDAYLTQAVQRIERLRDESGSFVELKASFPPSDLRPWGFHETYPNFNTQDQHDVRVTTGQVLGSPVIYDPKRVIFVEDAKEFERVSAIRAKTANERSQDEAHILQFHVLQTLYALTQGLFSVELTPVRMMNLSNILNPPLNLVQLAGVYDAGSLDTRAGTLWINGYFANDKNVVLPNAFNPEQMSHNLLAIRAKDTDLRNYPDNRFFREKLRSGLGVDVINRMYKPRRPQFQVLNRIGGAIGMYITLSQNEEKTNRVIELDGKDITHAMASLKFHPISASPNLAKAFASELLQYFTARVFNLISANVVGQARNIARSKAMNPSHFLQSIALARKGRIECSTGTIPRFSDWNGNNVSLNDAYVYDQKSKQLVLASHVNPEYTCVPTLSVVSHAYTIQPQPPIFESAYTPVSYNGIEFFVPTNSISRHVIEQYT